MSVATDRYQFSLARGVGDPIIAATLRLKALQEEAAVVAKTPQIDQKQAR
ncbi:MAG: hypothetical protein ABSA68_14185 [Xanthobacteraceae bacterium]